MRIKSFIASTVQEALASVRREMGDSSIILETRNIEEGDIKSRDGQTLVEVVAAENVNNQLKDENQYSDQDADINNDSDGQCDVDNLNHETVSQLAQNSVKQDQNIPVENLCAEGRIGDEIKDVTLADRLQPEDIIEMAGYRVDKSPVKIIDGKSCQLNKNWPEKSKELYKQLREQQVEKEHSRVLINEALHGLSKDDYGRIDLQRMMVKKCIIKKIKYNYTNAQDEYKTVVFVGTSGSGKTTTISKLAAEVKKNINKDVLFISIRGNSVEKLKKTADLIGATVMTVTTQLELREIIDKHGNASHIFVDTPAISIFDDNTLMILKGYLEKIPNIETHLVISATTRYVDIINIIKKVTVFPVHRLLFTKIDETNLHGTLFSVAMETQIPLSCITDGHDIPEDIIPITAEMVAEMVLGS